MKNLLRKINVNVILVIWIYMDFIALLMGLLIPGFYGSLIKYFIFSLLTLVALVHSNFYISKKLLYFIIIYLSLLCLNILLVDYKYYVIIDGLTSLVMLLPCFYIVSNKEFNFDSFLEKWNDFSYVNSIFILLSFILYYFKIASYNIFAVIILPNLLIQCYSYSKVKEKKMNLLYIITEFLLLILFGGRLASMVACIIILYALIFLRKTTVKRKLITFGSLFLAGVLILINLKYILWGINSILKFLNISSRNIILLSEQLESGSLWSNLYLSRRDIIYTKLLDYLKYTWLLPSGFGVTRYLSNGAFYHAHNIFLQMATMFGVPLSIVLIVIFVIYFKKRLFSSKKMANFLVLLLIFYGVRSIFDTYFLTHYASVLLLALVFLYQEKEYVSFKKMVMSVVTNILWLLPNRALAHKIFYFLRTRKKLNLDDPKTLNEKIQYLIANVHEQREADLADKYKVRDYIKKLGYDDLLPKLYATYSSVDEIDISKLPDTFVLKANNTSGYVFVCTDKKKFDLEFVKKQLDIAMHQNFGKKSLEYHYSLIRPLIVCEEYIGEIDDLPIDYKFYCFDGKVDSVLLNTNRTKELKFDFYDLNFKYLNYIYDNFKNGHKAKKPKNFDKMVKIASDLSKGFPFVRVDLYNCNGKIYFGEMTFTPHSGVIDYITEEGQRYYGSLVDLSEVKKHEQD